jgi:hypothetical protein
MACPLARFIARDTRTANVRSNFVDGAGGQKPDLAEQGGTTFSVATHAIETPAQELMRDAAELGFVLRREPWPIARERATGAAGPTGRS